MNLMRYRNRANYTTEMRLHDGTVERVKHCGRCMSVIPRRTCEHCVERAAKEDVKKEKFKQFLADRKGEA